MRVFLVFWSDPDDGNCQQWFLTHREAQAFAAEDAERSIMPRRVPLTRRGMIEWLNNNFVRDNG